MLVYRLELVIINLFISSSLIIVIFLLAKFTYRSWINKILQLLGKDDRVCDILRESLNIKKMGLETQELPTGLINK
ncbi:hypothetical protein L6452_17074 [Arctium lappa]|uniref:Uncharacterized protein n=1 Tax=Arctium lappa TaxID=4217 RepID=A0ACB9C2D6_ARCLA|nr:hypothetical protein L6452_17074 [Arctium lappa]